MSRVAINTMQNEILYKAYSYANGKYEEQAIYKEDVMKDQAVSKISITDF